jgi:hypothetical protein
MERREAVKQLIRWGRPKASEAEVEAVADSVLTDPVYREEIRRDAETLLLDPLRAVMHDIEYGSDE